MKDIISRDDAIADRPEIVRILGCQTRIDDIEATYQRELKAAKAEMSEATRELANVDSRSDHIRSIAYAFHHTAAKRKDLAWAMFGDEHRQWYLRKAVYPTIRPCTGCGEETLAGNDFLPKSKCFCERCSAVERSRDVDRQKYWREQDDRHDKAFRAAIARRAILESKEMLTQEDASELADLTEDERRYG
jgi:hypothetical protein